MEVSLTPTDIHAEITPDGNTVQLRFEGQGSAANLTFDRKSFVQTFDNLLTESRIEFPSDLDPEYPGLMTLEAHEARKNPSGNIEIKFHVRTDDGLRKVTMRLAPEKARSLGERLIQYSA